MSGSRNVSAVGVFTADARPPERNTQETLFQMIRFAVDLVPVLLIVPRLGVTMMKKGKPRRQPRGVKGLINQLMLFGGTPTLGAYLPLPSLFRLSHIAVV